jgi:hypothetical protein
MYARSFLALALANVLNCDPADYNPHMWIGDCKMHDMPQPLAAGKACTSRGLLILTSKTLVANDVRVMEESAQVACGIGETAYSLWYVAPIRDTDYDVYTSCNGSKVPIKDWFLKNPDAQLNIGIEHTPPLPVEPSGIVPST